MLNPWRLRLLGLLDSLGTVRAVAGDPATELLDGVPAARGAGEGDAQPAPGTLGPPGPADPHRHPPGPPGTRDNWVEFPWDRDLEIVPLGTDPVVLVLPSERPLAGRRVVGALLDHPDIPALRAPRPAVGRLLS